MEDITRSPLYSPDLAPIPAEKRTWTKWNLAALWVGMAVCIPTYLLASYMMRAGLSWQAALTIIGLANLVITLPMVLNGHPGVKYGIPFPVQGRAAFGTTGVHVPSLVRAIVACGWFGVQTWIGGLAVYSIWNAATGQVGEVDLSMGKFIAFGVFWLINIWFIWKGTESIRWLEDWSAPILILIGIVLIGWGAKSAGGFANALEQGKQLQRPSAVIQQRADMDHDLVLTPIVDKNGRPKATRYSSNSLSHGKHLSVFHPITSTSMRIPIGRSDSDVVYFTNDEGALSSAVPVAASTGESKAVGIWNYMLWFTAMVGFWATMSISISDITRYAKSQRDQLAGQFIGLPGTMLFYSFVGIFVTSAAVVAFDDVLIAEDAPWDPVSLVGKFESPAVVIFAQLALLIATLSTNIAANVIAPANAFSNLFPKKISFRVGGVIAGLVGIVICPWWLMNEISGILIFVSGLLGPVLGILLCDYFIVRKRTLSIVDLYTVDGPHAGVNSAAIVALVSGVLVALVGYWVKPLEFLYTLSWFSGTGVAFAVYWVLMRERVLREG
ncbi:MAG TPA: NCS1 family nucleobase:cation symporter-1 [Flavobacteriales bacterium]|nr:NCS1 family nucleobase:cation symporter-1 [Flavobacteriales bacterium]